MSKKKTIKIHPDYEPNTQEEFKQCLKSRIWRLHNLYTIRNKEAKLVPFKPNAEQLHLLHNMHTRNVILKIRQLGLSTFSLIFMLDAALFYPGVETGCIAHTREDAAELFENKVKLAYDNLPEQIRNMHKQTSDSARKLAFSNGSSIRIGTSFRSGTPVIVLVSEFGKISARYPEHAKEIQTGTFNAVPENGILIVESTAEGTDNEFYRLVDAARKKQQAGETLTPFDFKLFFFDWINTPQYVMYGSPKTISQELQDYFDQLEHELGVTIPEEKRQWYAAKSDNKLSPEMKREFPSTIDEAFKSVVEGAYFSKEMQNVRKEQRITHLKPDPNILVDTAWDLGFRDKMCIIFFQVLKTGYVNIIDYYENEGEGLNHYVNVLDEKRKEHGIIYGRHYVPHDAQQHSLHTGQTLIDYGMQLGIQFTALPRANKKQDKIETARHILHRSNFDTQRCSRLIECLDNYRRAWKTGTGSFSDKPLHNEYSHGADAFQEMAYAVENFGGSAGAMAPEDTRSMFEKYAPPVMM